MYWGENQEQYILEKVYPTLFHCLRGGIPPKCLKGCSLGILTTKKRGLVLFGGISKLCKMVKIDRGDNV